MVSELLTIAFIPETSEWKVYEQGAKPESFCRTWEVIKYESDQLNELAGKVLERSRQFNGHIIWCGSWARVKKETRAPIICDRSGKTFMPARVLLAKYLKVGYQGLPFPITPFCDAGKNCIKPEHQKPYVPQPLWSPDRHETFKEVTRTLERKKKSETELTKEPGDEITKGFLNEFFQTIEKKED